MRNRRAIGLIEAMLAGTLAALTFFVFITVFRSSYQQAAMTRNRAVAIALARSLMDEVEAHPYGTKEPASWLQEEEEPVVIVVQGRPVQMSFRKKIEFRNGSFIDGSVGGNSDVVTLTISWEENVGDSHARPASATPSASPRSSASPSSSASPNPSVTPGPEMVKELVVRVPVWR